MDYGDNMTIKIEKVKPKLYLQDCLLEIEVGESVRCTCRVSSLSEATVLWYHDSQIVFSNTSNVLEFKAEKNATFICRMYTSDNLTAGELEYSPKILDKKQMAYNMIV
uniref:Ig-like domain-containing protein n=1 Tax=Biomphalaria glabrata TaxID=6526 RepID=A0A2C9LFS6_BIOGL